MANQAHMLIDAENMTGRRISHDEFSRIETMITLGEIEDADGKVIDVDDVIDFEDGIVMDEYSIRIVEAELARQNARKS